MVLEMSLFACVDQDNNKVEIRDGESLSLIGIIDHKEVTGVRFAHEPGLVVTWSRAEVVIWDIEFELNSQGDQIAVIFHSIFEIRRSAADHLADVVDVAFSPQDLLRVLCAGQVSVWNYRLKTKLWISRGSCYTSPSAFSHDGTKLILPVDNVSDDYIWVAPTSNLTKSERLNLPSRPMDISPTSSLLAIKCANGLQIYNFETGESVCLVNADLVKKLRVVKIAGIAFSKDGSRLAATTDSFMTQWMLIYETATWTSVCVFEVGYVDSFRWNSTGTIIALWTGIGDTSENSYVITFRDVASSEVITSLPGPNRLNGVWVMDYSPAPPPLVILL